MKRLLSVILFMTLAVASVLAQTDVRVIAHRGFWDREGSAQNSRAALCFASQAGVFGSEFDVCVTKDGVPVVNHDDDIQGFVIADNKYKTIMNLRLPNGEVLPTLRQYLRLGKKEIEEGMAAGRTPIKLILELKPCASKELEERAVDIVAKIIRKESMPVGSIEFISFSIFICQRFSKLFPDVPVAYLGGILSPAELLAQGIWNLDYNYSFIHTHPQWVDEAHNLGMKVNVWTVDDIARMKELIDLGVDYITTNKPLELNALLK